MENFLHRCTACGGSCGGVKVAPLNGDEQARIEQIGRDLGISPAWTDGFLTRRDGACAFLQSDGLCGIHARLGFDAKPGICKQYPFIWIRTESGEERRGIDPGCYNWTLTANQPGPFSPHAVRSERPLPPPHASQEQSFLQADPQSLEAIVAWLDPALSLDRYRRDWARVLQSSALPALAMKEDAGAAMRMPLLRVFDAASSWDVDAPPPWPTGEVDAHHTEAIRRMVWLRLAKDYPPKLLVHALLGGALAWSWTDPEAPEISGAWCRFVRLHVVMSTLVRAFNPGTTAPR